MNTKLKQYKYNEKAYAELVYNKGFQTKYLMTELKLLALYLRDVLNLTLKQRTEHMYNFCQEHIPNYNKAKYFRIIDLALKYSQSKKRQLVVIPKIEIYENEVNFINRLTDIDDVCKKVLFTFMVQKKLDNVTYMLKNGKESNSINFKGGKQKYNNIKTISNIPSKTKINDGIINTLHNQKYIAIKYAGLIELLYLTKLEPSGDIVIEVKNYNNIGLYLDYYNKVDKVRLCKYCEQPFLQTKNDILYCKEHKGYQKQESKTIVCEDCGKEFMADSKANNRIRCDDCSKTKQLEWQRKSMKNKRNKIE